MRRRIIKQGNNSFTSTVPIKWIKENNLEAGDEIEVFEEDNKLIISPPLKLRKHETPIDIDVRNYNKRSIIISLHQAYRKGFDKIKITYSSVQQSNLIKNIVKNTLLGFEVVEEIENQYVIQNIAEPSSDKFDVILRKMMLIIKEESQKIISDIKSNTFDLGKSKEVKEIYDNFNNYARRIIIKNKEMGTKNSYLLFYFVSQMSLLQHTYYYLYKVYCKKHPKKIEKYFISLLQNINDSYILLYDSFYKKDILLADQTRSEIDNILKDIQDKISEKKGFTNKLLLILSSMARIISVSTTVLFGLDFKESDKNL